ncbi:hypothetical protein LOZ61_006168 [Ophidiomyces ophidiicola]|uniref:Uncharacterized protein n=1 Tax=Ophidiomyces ophidiicola TaxID=1387563 RepID=A0ACB8UQR4_9EURO|nr:hypothetical protein LOZ61_006168 [Ophidiomyces ophidiicola]KAI1915897.1 hypothetical protein LOZ65_005349 [Ophidiomyces ophidiicola]KAI1922351.1 hypothetical protein LOZ60_005727 [Ophidiomyces ophidiicola]KAI1951414.1 hypothetical protein LOZ59_005621 [Ophidiomyces ophidiicola]KAI1966875.1 hypothetical protein LOZ58_000365 [Ophidiomyces ophidiicola]
MATTRRTTTTTVRLRKFHWPEIQLNLWILIVLAASATCLGIFSWFMVVQDQMRLPTPWIFPFMVATGSLGVAFVLLVVFLIFQNKLIPEIILLGSFILFTLWLTGLIGISLQLYGAVASVNANCQNYVEAMVYRGASINTLAWLTQWNICNCWKAAFSFSLVNTIFFVWMLFMAMQVRRGSF